MRIISFEIQNFGPHRHVRAECGHTNRVLILGPNGSGKSQILAALKLILTGDHNDVLSTYIRHTEVGEPEVKAADVKVAFEKDSVVWEVSYRITSSKTSATLRERGSEAKPTTGVNAVMAKLQEIFGTSCRVLENGVFIEQSEMHHMMMGTDSERRKFLLKLCGVAHMDAVDTKLSARLSRYKVGLADHREGKLAIDTRVNSLMEQIKEANIPLQMTDPNLDLRIETARSAIRNLAVLASTESAYEEARRARQAADNDVAAFDAVHPEDTSELPTLKLAREAIVERKIPLLRQKAMREAALQDAITQLAAAEGSKAAAEQALELARSVWTFDGTPDETVSDLMSKLTNGVRLNALRAEMDQLTVHINDTTTLESLLAAVREKQTAYDKISAQLESTKPAIAALSTRVRDALSVGSEVDAHRMDEEALAGVLLAIPAARELLSKLEADLAEETRHHEEVMVELEPLQKTHAELTFTRSLHVLALSHTEHKECPFCAGNTYDPVVLAENKKKNDQAIADLEAKIRICSSRARVAAKDAAKKAVDDQTYTLNLLLKNQPQIEERRKVRGDMTEKLKLHAELPAMEKELAALKVTLTRLEAELSLAGSALNAARNAADRCELDRKSMEGRLASIKEELGTNAELVNVDQIRLKLNRAEAMRASIRKAESDLAGICGKVDSLTVAKREAFRANALCIAPAGNIESLQAEADSIRGRIDALQAVVDSRRALTITATTHATVEEGAKTRQQQAEAAVDASGLGRDVDAIRASLADLEAAAATRNDLRERVRVLTAEHAAATEQQADIEKLIIQNSRRQAAVDIIEFLRKDLGAAGVVGDYLQSVFNKLTRLARPGLGVLNANFHIEPDPENPLAWRFYRDTGAAPMSQDKFSGGQRGKLGVAFLWAVQKLVCPDLGFLVLDEPSTHMDNEAVSDLRNFLSSFGLASGNGASQVWVCDHHGDLQTAFEVKIDTRKSRTIDLPDEQ